MTAQEQCGDYLEYTVEGHTFEALGVQMKSSDYHSSHTCTLPPDHHGQAHYDGCWYWDHEQRIPFWVLG